MSSVTRVSDRPLRGLRCHLRPGVATSVTSVPVRRIDHGYAETRRWEQSVAWEELGFSFIDWWKSEVRDPDGRTHTLEDGS